MRFGPWYVGQREKENSLPRTSNVIPLRGGAGLAMSIFHFDLASQQFWQQYVTNCGDRV